MDFEDCKKASGGRTRQKFGLGGVIGKVGLAAIAAKKAYDYYESSKDTSQDQSKPDDENTTSVPEQKKRGGRA